MCMREPEHDTEFAELVRRASATLMPVGEPVEEALSLEKFRQRRAELSLSPSETRRSNARPRQMLYVAASVMTILAGAIGLYATRHLGNAKRDRRVVATSTYQTKANERVTVRVGTATMTLAPVTTVTALTFADGGGAEIRLDGEAIFKVTSSERSPFVVSTGHSTVRVLGTAFAVRRYATDGRTRVVVFDGRVAVRGSEPSAGDSVLSPNMLATISDSGRVTVQRNVRTSDYTAWTNGRLVFNDAPVRAVLADLGRAYDLDIKLADSTLVSHRLTLTIPVENQSATQVLRVLEAILDARVVRSGRIITLVPGRAPTRRPEAMRLFPAEVQYGR
jgi:transmembrane sensor